MLIVKSIGERNHARVEAVVTGLVSSDEENRTSPRVERVEHAERTPSVLHAKLPHLRVPRTLDS